MIPRTGVDHKDIVTVLYSVDCRLTRHLLVCCEHSSNKGFRLEYETRIILPHTASSEQNSDGC